MRPFMRLGLLLSLAPFLHFMAGGQQPPQADKALSLAGFSYKEKVENAAVNENGLPVVIALHWSGSSPDEFASFITGFTRPVRILLVEGLYPHPRGGRSFYVRSPKDYYADMTADEKMKNLLSEAEKLSKFIEAATAKYLPKKRPIVIGASQGGDLSYVTAVRYGSLISGAFPLLATLDERIITNNSTRKKPAPIYAFHGSDDPIVPIATAKQHIESLKSAGYNARLYTYSGVKHDIPDAMKTDYIRQIGTILFKD